MASVIRPSASSAAAAFRTASARQARSLPRQIFRQQSRRAYARSSSSLPTSGRPHQFLFGLAGLGLLTAGGVGFTYLNEDPLRCDATSSHIDPSPPTNRVPEVKASVAAFDDYQNVYDTIAERLEEHDDYEDGSYGPVVLRLAWHCSGTFEKNGPKSTGGSNGATMRFDPESEHGANNGLKIAREFLEPVKAQYPWISYSDLWTLAGVCAVQEMQGPIVPWRPGRMDRDQAWCTPEGRLPDGTQEQNHLRRIFGRMGFNDQEIVALSGAHALGRCHVDRSGFDGPWTFSPTIVTNDYFRLLVDENWHVREWDGERQWQDDGSRSLMMLPTDMALVDDPEFRPYVEKYAKDNGAFFEDFSDVLCKLFELGVPTEQLPETRYKFKPRWSD